MIELDRIFLEFEMGMKKMTRQTINLRENITTTTKHHIQTNYLLTAQLARIRSLATRQHRIVRRPSARQRTRVDTLRISPRHIIIGIEHVQPARGSGTASRRIRQRGEACATNLTGVRALAACQFGRVAG